MSALEKAARALCEADGVDPDTVVILDPVAEAKGFFGQRCRAWCEYVSDARAVLLAIRDPDDVMMWAGGSTLSGLDMFGCCANADDVFTAMIDAILAEPTA